MNFLYGWGRNFQGQLCLGFEGHASAFLTPFRSRLINIEEIAAGGEFGIARMNDNSIRTWGGQADGGQLGNNSFVASAIPVNPGLTNVTRIAAHGDHSMALIADGTIRTWGSNIFGSIGNGETGGWNEGHRGNGQEWAVKTPYTVPGITEVASIANGSGVSAAVMKNGTVKTWGENLSGQLGDGTTVEKTKPTSITSLKEVKKVVFGGTGGEPKSHMLILLENGTLMAAGSNQRGQFGLGSTVIKASSTPVAAATGLTEIVDIAAVTMGSYALTASGDLYAWGWNRHYQLGLGSEEVNFLSPTLLMKNVTAFSPYFEYGLAIQAEKVYGWGFNLYGELGDGSKVSKSSPTLVPGFTGVTHVSAGEVFSMAISTTPGPGSDILGEATLGTAILGAEESYPVITAPEGINLSKEIAMTPVTITATFNPTSWELVNAPPGITINSSGVISGTTAIVNNYWTVVKATNNYGTSQTEIFFKVASNPSTEKALKMLV